MGNRVKDCRYSEILRWVEPGAFFMEVKKHMANKTTSPTKVIIPCRISFANIWEPKSINGGDEKYSVSLLIPKEDKATDQDPEGCGSTRG